MTSHLRIFAALTLLGVVAGIATVWLQFRSSSESIPVAVATVEVGPVRAVARALQPASIRSCRSQSITTLATPTLRIGRLLVGEGQVVRSGEPLLQLDDPAQMAELFAARQDLTERRSEARSVCETSAGSRRAPRRLDPLIRHRVEEAGHAAHRTPSPELAAGSTCLAARLAQQQATVRYRAAGVAVAALTIRAPTSGMVTELTASAGTPPGRAPLMRIAELSCLQLRASLPAAAHSSLRNGMPVCIAAHTPSALPDCTARLQRVVPSSNARQTTIDVALTRLPAGTNLGEPLDVSVPLGDADDGVRIVRIAVMGDTDNPYVWRLDAADSSVRRQSIQKGLDDGIHVEVIAGLMPGERVAIPSPDIALQDGLQVEVIEPPAAR